MVIEWCNVQTFKYNTLETLYLVTSLFILLAGKYSATCIKRDRCA